MALDLFAALIGVVIGFALGYFYSKNKVYQDTDISNKSVLLQGLTTQITEMKMRFDAIEKAREEKDKTDAEIKLLTEKRYSEFMEATKKFFESQEELRKNNEEKRDKQVGQMAGMIEAFTRTIHGTKTRGMVGEEVLRSYLHEAIRTKLIKSPLKTENGEVEFAWSLDDGKYIPIDAKLPDVQDLLESLAKDDAKQMDKTVVRKKIHDMIKREIENIRKYQNHSNTIDKCILCVPKGAIDIAPELIHEGSLKNVLICSYENVFLICFLVSEEYKHMKETGEIGELKTTIGNLTGILKEIVGLSDTLDRQARSVVNYNEKIRDKVQTGLRL